MVRGCNKAIEAPLVFANGEPCEGFTLFNGRYVRVDELSVDGRAYYYRHLRTERARARERQRRRRNQKLTRASVAS